MKVEEQTPLKIKSWSPEDRPREKLLLKGTAALSEAELIAILIGSGTARLSAVEVAKKILQQGGSNLNELARLTVNIALEELACGIIVAHNHPSGNLAASQSDIDLTKKLKEAGKFLEIQLLDHLIVANQKYFSFADEGLI
jgi:DNA repair protein RadC